jgi:hypothetical protein
VVGAAQAAGLGAPLAACAGLVVAAAALHRWLEATKAKFYYQVRCGGAIQLRAAGFACLG